jgi:hypothetical protein
MILFIKKWTVEIVSLIGNLILLSKYLFDKASIRCEPCIDINDCPPCQTEFMRYFWYYFIIFNTLILIGLITKRKKNKRQPTPGHTQLPRGGVA